MHAPLNEPKRHHINPQILLREFADGRGRVRVTPRHEGAPRLQHISNVSVVRHANTMQTDTGRDYSLERLLSKIEGHFPDALKLLDLPQRTPEQDALVLSLVATQAGRDPNIRTGFFDSEIVPISAALRHALREHDPAITEAQLEAEIDHYGRNHVVKPHVSPTPANVAVARDHLAHSQDVRGPRSVPLDGSPFGAVLLHHGGQSGFGLPESVHEHDEATFRPDTEFLIPVTPAHAVLITARHALPQRVDADLSIEAVINARTARAALREVYSRPDYPLETLTQHFEGWWASLPLLRYCLDRWRPLGRGKRAESNR